METAYLWLANLIIVFHFLFIVFVLLGGLLLLRWPRLIYVHLPAIAWGFLVELNGWICPLTPWENHFRQLAGKLVYEGDFIGEYLIPLIYPLKLTREMQYLFAAVVMLINVTLYLILWRRYRRRDNATL